ncbi:MAG: GNAT family N-acetyltransferase [Rhodomicrobium sp.]|nr:GNAT family N-acetyltransferase [Rhodomicrobium sp.]
MTPTPTIKDAAQADRDKAIDTIVLGFAADPMTRWLWRGSADYLAAMPRFARAFGGRAFDHSTAFLADEGRAVALWLPPGVEPDDEAMAAVAQETAPPDLLEEMGGVLEAMARYHPHEPHWYLPLIAADPAWIGRGLGAALMKHALQKCDEDGVIAYLESSNPRNISLYERHGFEIIGEIQSGSSPVLTPMLRRAR